MILLDTDICIEILRGNRRVISERARYREETAISFMTVGELFYGVFTSRAADKNRKLLEIFLLSLRIINSNTEIMERFGELKSRLQEAGRQLPDADIMIAATCFTHCTLLVTGNTKHFSRFENLACENWARKG